MGHLRAENARIAENLSNLRGIHDELDSAFRNLSSDPDTIAVYAHELGYVADSERLIKLADFTGGIAREYNPGFALKAATPASVPEWICKALGLFAGLVAFALFSIFRTEASHDIVEKRAGIGAYYGGIPSR